ncbi:hypothetical protein ACNKU7_08890 [Microbulbifer sp. SA54]|uniref:hypothetical protein n=1 Tax=Microbulbifer sp. SA54 TaxID=3401577 RepID=UPI003AACAD9D
MKGTAVVLAALLSLPGILAAEETYILFDIEVSGYRDDDPVWLAVEGPDGLTHWRVEKYIFAISPGKYRVDHVDFHESIRFRHGTLHIGEGESITFDVRSGFINFLGTLLVEKKKRQGLEMRFKADESLVRLGCQLNPAVFSELKVVVALLPDQPHEYEVDCTDLASE